MWKGLLTAIITPFSSDGSLDMEGLRQHVARQWSNKVDGLVILGTTGETTTLSWQEQQQIVTAAVEESRGKGAVLVGTGLSCTKKTVEKTQWAKELGADGALVVTPYYNRPMQEGIYAHFAAICREVALPLCVYHIPARTGCTIDVATMEKIAQLDHVVAIKESSRQWPLIDETIHRCQNSAVILSGDDALTLSMIALGAKGVISVASNVEPEGMCHLTQAALEGEMEAAKKWHRTLFPLFQALCLETNPIPIKAAMELRGFAAGCCRLPLTKASVSTIQQIAAATDTLHSGQKAMISN